MTLATRLLLGTFLVALPIGAQAQDPAPLVSGKWRSSDGEVVTISQSSDGRIALAGKHDDWRGTLQPGKAGERARLRFTRQPSADEMDAAAPPWVRQAVQGKVEWVLEFDLTECPLKLSGRWYKGRIAWKDNDKSSPKVLDRGEGVAISYEWIDSANAAAATDQPALTSEVSDKLAAAQKAYNEAKADVAKKATALAEAIKALDASRAALNELVSRNDAAFQSSTQKINELSAAISEALAELAAIDGDFSAGEQQVQALAELRRKWDILTNVDNGKYAQYVAPGFLRALADEIDATSKRLAQAKETRDKNRAPLIAKLDRLQKDLDAARALRIKSIVEFASDERLSKARKTFVEDTATAELARIERGRAGDKEWLAFKAYAALLGESAPPFLEMVSIAADGKAAYRAKWARTDVSVEELKSLLVKIDADIARLQAERDEGRTLRDVLAFKTTGYGPKMELAAQAAAESERMRIITTSMIEGAFVVVEVALTGGTATAARYATELAEKGLEAGSIRITKPLVSLRAAVGFTTEEVIAAKAQQVLRNRVARAAEEAAVASRKFANAITEARTAQYVAQGFSGKEAAALAAKDASKVIGDIAPEKLYQVTMAEVDKQIAARAAAAAKAEKIEAAKGAAGSIVSKPAAAYMTFSGPDYGPERVHKKSKCDNPAVFYQFEGADRDVLDAMAVQFVQDALEVVFARAIKAGVAGLPTSVKAALENGGLTRWSAIVSGGRAFIGEFPRKHVLDAIKPGRGDIITLASGITKQYATYVFAKQKDRWDAEYAQAAADWTVAYSAYRLAVCDDQRLWNEIQAARRMRADVSGRLAAPWPRKLSLEADEELPSLNANITITLDFAGFLDKAPVVTLGDAKVTMSPKGEPENAAAHWSGETKASTLGVTSGVAPLRVNLASGALPFAALDSDPASVAFLDPATSPASWQRYEAGPDAHHRLKLCKAQ